MKSGVPQLLALLLLTAAVSAQAAESLNLIISTETAPAGGTVQLKVRAAEPRRISTGWLELHLDNQYIDRILNVTGFSASGDAMGYMYNAVPAARLDSPSGGMGQLPDLPVLTVTAALKPNIPTGTVMPVTVVETETRVSPFNPELIAWRDADGAQYDVTVQPGAIRIGGTLSVSDVRPGGGVLASGTTLTITGTGFDANTAVTIDGLTLRSVTAISDRRIEAILGSTAELTGRHLRIRNAAGEQADFYLSSPTLPPDAAATDSHMWVPITDHRTGSGGDANTYATQVLTNTNPYPVEVIAQTAAADPASLFTSRVIAPGEQFRIAPSMPGHTGFRATAGLRSAVHNRANRAGVPPVNWTTLPNPSDFQPLSQPNLSDTSIDISLPAGSPTPRTLTLPLQGPQRVRLTKPASATWLTLDPSAEVLDVPAAGMNVITRISAANLKPGSYTANLVIAPVAPDLVPDLPVRTVTATLNLTVTSALRATATASDWSPPAIAHVVNAASQLPTPLVPGALYTLHGTGIGGTDDLDLRINSEPVEVLYNSPNQINFQAPDNLREGTVARLTLRVANLAAPAWELPVAATAPGMFTANSTGRGAVVSTPVHRPTFLFLTMTGRGRSPQTLKATLGGIEVPAFGIITLPTIGGNRTGPDLVSVVILENAPTGTALPLIITVDGVPTQPGVTLSVE